ncbi:unnamed protein product [Polarella glacialis]|uniref:Uncharacterized protein n=1 Tax=Polarella glacialis TaxID=89957 RepID=A0A813FD18_POLGL|nr:unnamed protein product [Polarella glacialis]CAE8681684.1 unnamed protein product [Polarella glacialis]
MTSLIWPRVAVHFAWQLVVLLTLPGSAGGQGATVATSGTTFSYGWLSVDKASFCRNVPHPPPLLDEISDYPPVAYETQANYATRIMLRDYRGANQITELMQMCPLTGREDPENEGVCSEALTTYLNSLLMWGSPILASLVALALLQVCFCTAACRCCRRCCLCSERKGARDARWLQKIAIGLFAPIGIGVGFVTVLVAFDRSGTFNGSIADMLCHTVTMADEALNGSPQTPRFLGIDTGIQRIGVLRKLLDVDGRSMTDVRAILDETADFGSAMDDLLARISHMQKLLTLVGQYKIKDHTCWFCQRAVGSNTTGELGLLNELRLELTKSSADAMRSIRETTSATLTGRPLVDVSAAVQRGGASLEVFKLGFAGSIVEGLLSFRREIQTYEDLRHTSFVCLCAFAAALLLVISTGALVYVRRSRARWPTATPSCISFFCSFCVVILGLLFGGILVIVAVPVSELCGFMRYDLLTPEGLPDYYKQMGFYNPADPAKNMDRLAVAVAQTCLSGNGTGDILGALNLRQQLNFQQVLDDEFVALDDKTAGMVVDNAKFELLVSQAASFGGLFILDPDQPLPLDTNAAPKIMGSSLDADDQLAPDGESLIYGLNTYAALIAGPGQYSFAHGTSGGGTLITATRPTEAEVSTSPQRTQNALVYARLKEQIITQPGLFRCDVLDASHRVTEIFCDYARFKASILDWSKQVQAAGTELAKQSTAAKTLIASDLRISLQSVLKEVRDLRTLFRCRFIWKRWEDFDFTLCNAVLPAAIEGAAAWLMLAAASFVLMVIHYKVWRHLLDNNIVGKEVEHYSKKYGYITPAK